MRTLHKSALRRRDQEHRKAVAALSSARFARLALRVQAWTLTPAPKGGRLARRAPKELARAHARLFDAARSFTQLSPQRRHRVRILAKRLRYALDVMSVALPAEPTARYVKALAELQDVLGELNDLAVASLMLKDFACTGVARASALGWFDERERARVEAAEQRLAGLAGAEPPWAL
jgi:CHAD domain-containing protein